VYRKATDFSKLISVSCYFAEAVYVSRSFEVKFFGSFRYKIMSSVSRDSLTTSLPICITFISLSCFIALSRNCKAMVNRSGESWHLVSFLTLGEMVSVFPH
jgi:hypothetical protein